MVSFCVEGCPIAQGSAPVLTGHKEMIVDKGTLFVIFNSYLMTYEYRRRIK